MENTRWGYWLGDVFIELPKQSLLNAGYADPPFDVTRPDGKVLRVVEKKESENAKM